MGRCLRTLVKRGEASLRRGAQYRSDLGPVPTCVWALVSLPVTQRDGARGAESLVGLSHSIQHLPLCNTDSHVVEKLRKFKVECIPLYPSENEPIVMSIPVALGLRDNLAECPFL